MSRGRPTSFDTEAVAAEIARDGIWPAAVRNGMSYQHAARIRSGWRPKKASDTRADKLARMAAAVESPHEAATAAEMLAGMQAWRQARQAHDPTALVKLCEVDDCGRKHYGHGLCNMHWQRAHRPAEPEVELQCGAETFDGAERRRCTRPAGQVRDGLLVCKQHEKLSLIYWVGAGTHLRPSLTARSVPQITARGRVPGGFHLFDQADGTPATRVEDLPVTPGFVRSRHPGDPAPSVREVFPK